MNSLVSFYFCDPWWLNYIRSHSSKEENIELKVIKCEKTYSEKHKGDSESEMTVNIEKLFELYEKHGSKDRLNSQMVIKLQLLHYL